MVVDYGPLELRLRDTLAPVQGSLAIELASIDVSLFRVPLDLPINTVFGPMKSRPAIFLRAVDKMALKEWARFGAISRCVVPNTGRVWRQTYCRVFW